MIYDRGGIWRGEWRCSCTHVRFSWRGGGQKHDFAPSDNSQKYCILFYIFIAFNIHIGAIILLVEIVYTTKTKLLFSNAYKMIVWLSGMNIFNGDKVNCMKNLVSNVLVLFVNVESVD